MMKWKLAIVAMVMISLMLRFGIPSAEAEKIKSISNQIEKHQYFRAAPVAKRLPFSTQVKGEVDKNSMWKCREGITETLARLPTELSSRLRILILNFEGGARGLADADTVILRCDVSKIERLRVFLHEMGHVVYLSSSSEIQADYKKLWEKSGEADFVSGYAKENEFEDFAESFLAFVEFGESFRSVKSAVLAEKYAFIEKNFFPDRVYNGDRADFALAFDMTKL